MREEELQEKLLNIFSSTTKTLNDLADGIEYLTPAQTDLYRTQLAALYGLLSEELAKIERYKPFEWMDIKLKDEDGNKRKKALPIKETDVRYDTTPNGQRRIEIKYRLKAIEKMISALASHLRRMSEEAKNIY